MATRRTPRDSAVLEDREAGYRPPPSPENITAPFLEGPSVTCGVCGQSLFEAYNLRSEERTPCPKCGSRRRSYRVTLDVSTDTSASLQTKVDRPRRGLWGFLWRLLRAGYSDPRTFNYRDAAARFNMGPPETERAIKK